MSLNISNDIKFCTYLFLLIICIIYFSSIFRSSFSFPGCFWVLCTPPLIVFLCMHGGASAGDFELLNTLLQNKRKHDP